MLKIYITTHYSENDEDFDGDYREIHVVVKDIRQDKLIFDDFFGDEYHDKAIETVDGFIQGFQALATHFSQTALITREKVADWEY